MDYNSFKQVIKKNILYFIFGPLIKIVEALIDLVIPLFMKAIIDLCFNRETSSLTKTISDFIKIFPIIHSNTIINYCLIGGLIILVIGLFGFLTTMVTQYLAAKCASICGSEIRSSLFNKILKMNKKEISLFSNNKIQTIINNDSYQAQQGILFFIRLVTRTPVIIIGSLILSFILDYKIGFLFLALVPIIIFIIYFFMGKSSKQYLFIQEQLETLSGKTSDNINGTRVIKVFNKENLEIDKFRMDAQKYVKESEKASLYNSFINPITFAFVSIIMILSVVIGSKQLENDDLLTNMNMSPSTLITLIAYLDQIFQTVIVLTNLIIIFVKSGASIKRIDSLLSFNPSIIKNSNFVKNINKGEEYISFENVSFKYYENSNNILENLNFKIKKSETIGVIGGTGSGKSTLALLIGRFLDSTKGVIKYKGVDIKEYSLTDLRKEVGISFQKPVLFKGDIKSNLLMANKKANEDDISNVLDIAMASSFVNSFDDKLNHQIIEGGLNLSGGQRQRLNIARTLIKKPELLILDDSTSALDLLTESELKKNINSFYPDLTKIIISQRISTIKNCDNILVLDKGRIVDIGKHDILLTRNKIYQEIYNSQVKDN